MKRAMILAAGRGERMGALTAELPKPLLRVGGRYLIEYAIASIKQAGITDIIINVFYQGHLIQQALGDGARYGVNIIYSEETERLEVGGGIVQALPLLGTEPFLVVSCDIITDYPLQHLLTQPSDVAHLVMVKNPSYHPQGDFGLRDGYIDVEAQPTLTFASVGVYRPELFAACEAGYRRWSSVLKPAIAAGRVTGECYQGEWFNVGTPADIAAAETRLNQRAREDSNLRPLASETNTLSN